MRKSSLIRVSTSGSVECELRLPVCDTGRDPGGPRLGACGDTAGLSRLPRSSECERASGSTPATPAAAPPVRPAPFLPPTCPPPPPGCSPKEANPNDPALPDPLRLAGLARAESPPPELPEPRATVRSYAPSSPLGGDADPDADPEEEGDRPRANGATRSNGFRAPPFRSVRPVTAVPFVVSFVVPSCRETSRGSTSAGSRPNPSRARPFAPNRSRAATQSPKKALPPLAAQCSAVAFSSSSLRQLGSAPALSR